MPDYIAYRDDLETIASDDPETHAKIIQVMTDGQNITREKYGRAVRSPRNTIPERPSATGSTWPSSGSCR